MKSTFQNIALRYRQEAPCSDDDRAKIWADVRTQMNATLGDGRSVAADSWLVGGGSWITDNGLPTINTRMSDTPSGRNRLEKARRDIEEHRRYIDWQEAIQAARVEWPSDEIAWLKDFIQRQGA